MAVCVYVCVCLCVCVSVCVCVCVCLLQVVGVCGHEHGLMTCMVWLWLRVAVWCRQLHLRVGKRRRLLARLASDPTTRPSLPWRTSSITW